MINIEIVLDKKELIKRVEVKGHSGFAKKGADIVCSSVSSLVLTSYIVYKKLLNENIELIDGSSFIYNIKSVDGYDYGELKGIALFLITGLFEIRKEYKKNIEIIIQRS